jgi:hypothetical protein
VFVKALSVRTPVEHVRDIDATSPYLQGILGQKLNGSIVQSIVIAANRETR